MAKAFCYCLQLYIVNNIVNNMLLTGATILFTILFEHIVTILKLFLSLEQCFDLFLALLFLYCSRTLFMFIIVLSWCKHTMFATIIFEVLVLHPMLLDVKSLPVIETDNNMESNSFITTIQRIYVKQNYSKQDICLFLWLEKYGSKVKWTQNMFYLTF